MSVLYPIPLLAEIRAKLLRDMQGLKPDALIGDDSDAWVRASATGNAIEGLYQHQRWIVRQFFPQTAEGEYLELHAQSAGGMKRKSATTTSGYVRLTGEPGSAIVAGVVLTQGGRIWQTTEAGVMPAEGEIEQQVSATAAGTVGNLEPGTQLTLASPPPGIDGTAVVVVMGGGTNQEDYEELRARLMFALQNPDSGGGKGDYKRWVLEVPGVTAAYEYAKRRGPGSVDVAITSAEGLPGPALLEWAQQHLDDVRPPEVDAVVFSPTLRDVDMVIHVKASGITWAGAQQLVRDTVESYFAGLAPGDEVVLSTVLAIIRALPAITDARIATPTSNVQATVNHVAVEWLRAGNISVGAMV